MVHTEKFRAKAENRRQSHPIHRADRSSGTVSERKYRPIPHF